MATYVSGRAFLGIIRHLRETGGSARVARVIDLADAREVFSERISKLGWYPYTTFTKFLGAAEKVLPKTERGASFDLGTVAGKQDLGTVLRIYAAIASPERLIKSCKLVWPGYYKNAGRMEAIEWAPESTVLRIHDFPDMHPLHCRLMEGWMISTMQTLGFSVGGDARQTKFMGDGAPYHEFRCTWRRG